MPPLFVMAGWGFILVEYGFCACSQGCLCASPPPTRRMWPTFIAGIETHCYSNQLAHTARRGTALPSTTGFHLLHNLLYSSVNFSFFHHILCNLVFSMQCILLNTIAVILQNFWDKNTKAFILLVTLQFYTMNSGFMGSIPTSVQTFKITFHALFSPCLCLMKSWQYIWLNMLFKHLCLYLKIICYL